jgi:CBS-domain-containing membrane protein
VALVEIMALFAEGAGTVPVVDGEQRLAGIVALETALQARGDPQVTAGDLAIPPSAVLFDTTVLEEAVMALAASPEGALPVVSRTGGVLGVLRSVDFTRWTAARLT